MNLKELYDKIKENESWYKDWYLKFENFAEKIQKRIIALNEKPIDTNNEDDVSLLKDILIENDNFVSKLGMVWSGLGVTKDEFFKYIINNNDFISSLQMYMQNPDDEEYFNKLQEACKYNSPIIRNRIAATCTQNVSTATKDNDFNRVVNYLEENEIIPKGSVSSKKTWFDKNKTLMNMINKELGDSANPYQKSAFVWIIKTECIDKNLEKNIQETGQSFEEYIKLLTKNHNLILTGAPGTGKTYLARQIAMQMIGVSSEEELEKSEQFAFVQFHPSYDYTDFVEGLRPINNENSDGIGFKLKSGIFKKFCEEARKAKLIQSGGLDNFDEAWKSFIEKVQEKDESDETYDEVKTLKGKDMKLLTTDNGVQNVVNDKRDRLYMNKEQCYKVYRGLPGVPQKGLDNYRRAIINHLKEKFELKDYSEGTKSENESSDDKEYVFVIDEINRGEISKIFGELFFSIDPSYRGKKGAVKTQYSNMHDDKNEKFYVPKNVYIIGTMNDIDRSVESFDFAMRRRFTWKEIKAEDSFVNMSLGTKENYENSRIKLLNDAIEKIEGLNSSYHIGGAYFLDKDKKPVDLENESERDNLWNFRLKPLLFEYLRGMPDAETKLKELKNAYDKTDANNG